jgi:hypothetical protein
MKKINVKLWLVLIVFALAGTLFSAGVIAETNNFPRIAPIQSNPHGHSYSEWGRKMVAMGNRATGGCESGHGYDGSILRNRSKRGGLVLSRNVWRAFVC